MVHAFCGLQAVVTFMNNERIFQMPFASVFCAFAKPPAKQGPHYVTKVEKSRLGGLEGRTKEELHTVIH